MAKHTDYKRLWRKEKDNVLRLMTLNQQLQQRNETLAETLIAIRDGQITTDDLKQIKKDHEATTQSVEAVKQIKEQHEVEAKEEEKGGVE